MDNIYPLYNKMAYQNHDTPFFIKLLKNENNVNTTINAITIIHAN